MASSLSPNHSVTKAQAPERRVAAETEGNDNGEHAGAQPFPSAALRVTAWMVSLIGQNFRGQRGILLPTPVTSVCLCEVGARRQKEDQKKKKIWKCNIFTVDRVKNENLCFNFSS